MFNPYRSPNSELSESGFSACLEAGVNIGVAVGVGVGKLSSPAPAPTPAAAPPDDLLHCLNKLLRCKLLHGDLMIKHGTVNIGAVETLRLTEVLQGWQMTSAPATISASAPTMMSSVLVPTSFLAFWVIAASASSRRLARSFSASSTQRLISNLQDDHCLKEKRHNARNV